MANYILHIELLGSPGENVYRDLQTFMAEQGFSMTITNDNGGSEPIILPQATYLGESSLTPADAANRLRNALREAIWPRVKVLALIYSSAALAA